MTLLAVPVTPRFCPPVDMPNSVRLLLVLLLGAHSLPLQAGDWPQILGPNRTGVAATDEKLAPSWPAAGPKVTWEKAVGSGYAGVAVVGSRAFLYHRLGDSDVLEALNASTGETLWKQESPTSFSPGVGSGDGPLCVPTVAGEHVVTFSPQGVLSVRQVGSGQLVWQKATHKEFGAQEGYFGAGNTPLVVGQVVIVNVGGARTGSGVVGFDLKTGATLWKQVADQASYSAPVLLREGEQPVVVVITRLKCVALRPDTGEVLWEIPFGQRGPTVNGAVPVQVKGRLFLTASYGIGGTLLDVKPASAEVIWSETESLASQYATPVESDGLLFGFHGRDDVPPAELRCVNPLATNEADRVLWSVGDLGYGTLIKADGKLLIATTSGELVLAEASRDRFAPVSRFQAFPGTIRALPALSGGGLFVRDDTTLKRYAVGR